MTALGIGATQRNWLKRLGVIGFGFFFVKGLLWLAAGLVFYLFV